MCTYHHLQRLLSSHSGVVCGHLSQRLLQRLYQQHHRAQHSDDAKHQAAVEPAVVHTVITLRKTKLHQSRKHQKHTDIPLRLGEQQNVCNKASPQVENSGVDAGAVGKQPVEHGRLPSHVERRQHQPSTGQPGLVTEAMCE